MSKKFPLDLSKFSHVSSDEHSHTLKHYEGHELKIATKKLSKEMKAGLKEMADKHAAKKPKKMIEPQPKMAEGGEVLEQEDSDLGQPETQSTPMPEMYAEGGVAGDEMNMNQFMEQQGKLPNTPQAVVQDDDAAWAQFAQQNQRPQSAVAPLVNEGDQARMATKEAAPLQMSPDQFMGALQSQSQPNAMPMGQIPSQQPNMASGMPGQQGMDGVPSPEGLLTQGYQSAIKGMQGEAETKGQLGQEQQAIYQKQAADRELAQKSFQDSYKALEQERQAHLHDIAEGYIDPEKYWSGDKNGNGSHSRIAAGIGMILAGFNPTTQPNAAINYLNHQMDMNLNAQKANLDSKHNLLAANLRQFGNLKDATDMTRIMQNDVVVNQLQAAMAKAATPAAKAEMQKAIGNFQMQSSQAFMQLSMRNAMMNLANHEGEQSEGARDQMLAYMRMTNPEMAKSLEQRIVPGIRGVATVPVPEKIREQLIAHQNVDRQMNEVLNFAKKNSNSVDPKVRAQGATMMNQLQSAIRVAESQGVYKESEANFMKDTMGDNPAAFFSKYTTVPKIKELQHQKQAEYVNMGKGYGLNPKIQQPEQEPVKGANGKMYRKVPGGWVPAN